MTSYDSFLISLFFVSLKRPHEHVITLIPFHPSLPLPYSFIQCSPLAISRCYLLFSFCLRFSHTLDVTLNESSRRRMCIFGCSDPNSRYRNKITRKYHRNHVHARGTCYLLPDRRSHTRNTIIPYISCGFHPSVYHGDVQKVCRQPCHVLGLPIPTLKGRFQPTTDIAGQTPVKSSVQRGIRSTILSSWKIDAETLEEIWPKKESIVHVRWSVPRPCPTPPCVVACVHISFGDTRTVESISPYTLCTASRSFSSTLTDHTFPLCVFFTNASSSIHPCARTRAGFYNNPHMEQSPLQIRSYCHTSA